MYCKTCLKLGVTEINQECESCLDDYKFYINEENNKKVCINIDSSCPENFAYYNELTKECTSDPIYICSIPDLISTSCSNLNFTNENINKKINNDLIPNYYEEEKGSIIIKGEKNSIFEIATTDFEQKRLLDYGLESNGLSIVILGNCENLLKVTYGIDKNLALIIKKYEQITISAERNVQYEVYDPVTKKN